MTWTKFDEDKLKNLFQVYSKVGDRNSDGSTIKLSQSDKWLKEAGIIRRGGSLGGGLSTTDTGIAFRRVSQ